MTPTQSSLDMGVRIQKGRYHSSLMSQMQSQKVVLATTPIKKGNVVTCDKRRHSAFYFGWTNNPTMCNGYGLRDRPHRNLPRSIDTWTNQSSRPNDTRRRPLDGERVYVYYTYVDIGTNICNVMKLRAHLAFKDKESPCNNGSHG